MYGTVPGTPRWNDKTYFGLHIYLAGRCSEIPKVPGAQGNNMVSSRNYLLYHFSIRTIHLHVASFYATKYFWNS